MKKVINEQRNKGTMEQRNKGTKKERNKGTKEQKNKGTKEQRNNETTEQRNKGTKEQRNKGTKKQKVHPIGSGVTRSPGLVLDANNGLSKMFSTTFRNVEKLTVSWNFFGISRLPRTYSPNPTLKNYMIFL